MENDDDLGLEMIDVNDKAFGTAFLIHVITENVYLERKRGTFVGFLIGISIGTLISFIF